MLDFVLLGAVGILMFTMWFGFDPIEDKELKQFDTLLKRATSEHSADNDLTPVTKWLDKRRSEAIIQHDNRKRLFQNALLGVIIVGMLLRIAGSYLDEESAKKKPEPTRRESDSDPTERATPSS